MERTDWDVIIYDTVCAPYTRSMVEANPTGGSEIARVKLAHGLADAGYSVLVLNNIDGAVEEGGVTYANASASTYVCVPICCKAMVVSRFSEPPKSVIAERIVVVADDIYQDYQRSRFEALITPEGKGPLLVCSSPWHASLYPDAWEKTVIPCMLPDELYDLPPVPKNPNKFVYASAVCKGLRATLAKWQHMKKTMPQLKDAELHVTTAGYDTLDPAIIEAHGAKWVGELSPGGVVELLRDAAGLFFVNTFPETFCNVAALAEVLGCRTHILAQGHDGAALWTTCRSRFVTKEEGTFEREFLIQYVEDTTNGIRETKPILFPDRRVSTVVHNFWGKALGLSQKSYATFPRNGNPRPTICLVMIVKEGAEGIEKAVSSVRDIISNYCVIVDTGSSALTTNKIRLAFGTLPGEIIEEPWVNFGANRTKSLEHARGMADYNLILDCDDQIAVEDWADLSFLNQDQYDILCVNVGALGSTEMWRTHIFRNDSDYFYEGAAHEVLQKFTPTSRAIRLYGMTYMRFSTGTNRPAGYTQEGHRKNAALLEKTKSNPRDAFYLAQSYRDAGAPEKAMAAYIRRAEMTDGYWEERFVSLLEAARITIWLGLEPKEVEAAFQKAIAMRPERAPEALRPLAQYWRDRREWAKAYETAKSGLGVPVPTEDKLFVDRSAYEWWLQDEFAIAAFYAGHYDEGRAVNEALLASGKLPTEQRQHVLDNLAFFPKGPWKGKTTMIDGPLGPFEIPAEPETTHRVVEQLTRGVWAGEYDHPELPSAGIHYILDVGAGWGAFAVWAKRKWEPNVIFGYEPHHAAAEICARNAPFVELREVAVTSNPNAVYAVGTDWGNGGTHEKTVGEKVKTRHPRDLPAADILKVDAEGIEVDVVMHYKHLATLKALIYEFHSPEHRKQLNVLCRAAGLACLRQDPEEKGYGTAIWIPVPR